METFTKLASSITESSVWQEPDGTRLVWITLLAMKDANGRVHASIPGLAHRARVPLEATRIALETFLSPDPYSRTPDHEGRRLEVIEGGWRLLNHAKYRDTRDKDERREYKTQKQREYRARGQAVDNVDNCGQVWTGVDKCGPPWTHTDTDTDTDTDTSTHSSECVGGVGEGNALAEPTPASPAGQAAGAASRAGKRDTVEKQEAKPARPSLCDDEYLTQLQGLDAYAGVNVRAEYQKMVSWCWVNGKHPTRRRLVNWLNKCDRPMTAAQPVPQQTPQAKSVWTLKQQLEQVQHQIAEIERDCAIDTPHGMSWVDGTPEGTKARYGALRAQRRALRERIAAA